MNARGKAPTAQEGERTSFRCRSARRRVHRLLNHAAGDFQFFRWLQGCDRLRRSCGLAGVLECPAIRWRLAYQLGASPVEMVQARQRGTRGA